MKDLRPPGEWVSLVPPIRSDNACCHPSICTRKGHDPLEVHTLYTPFKFCCYQWFPHLVGTSCSCWQTTSKFHLSDPSKKINLTNKITVWHTRFYTVIFVQARGAHKHLPALILTYKSQLATIPYQIRSSSSGLRKANLPATWVISFNWLISYLSFIDKMHYNWGYGLVAISGKWPTHKQWNFLVSRNIFFGHNSTILSLRKTSEVVVRKK